MHYLEVRDLAFAYQKTQVFTTLNMEVEKGEIFCLVGPNGCGKTTLQHCLLGLNRPLSGQIMIQGRELSHMKEKELAHHMAYVPQNHAPTFPYLTLDVVAMGSLRTRGFLGQNDQAGRKQALEILDRLGIRHLAQSPYTGLSGGEMQLVLIARALCQKSQMLVLDEPTAHLDIGRSQDILRIISQINREEGITVLMATHDFNQPLYFEDQGNPVRMALMSQGRISQIDRPTRLLSSGAPEDLYGVKSKVITIEADRTRHYLATWKEDSNL